MNMTREQKIAELKTFFNSLGIVVNIDQIMRDQVTLSRFQSAGVNSDLALDMALDKLRAVKGGGSYGPQTLTQANLKIIS
jgi:hypothetical protein